MELARCAGSSRSKLCIRTLFTLSLLASMTPLKASATLAEGKLVLNGKLIQQKENPNISLNISGIAARNNILVAGPDEGGDLLIFKKTAPFEYSEANPACVPLDNKSCGEPREGLEIDIEGVAWSNQYLYVIGSHSKARKAAKAEKTAKENRKRLNTIKTEPTREQLFRLRLTSDGKVETKEQVSLHDLLADNKILATFLPIPSKENGIDIEGLGVLERDGEDELFIGFRGPVLRGNHAVIMGLKFKNGKFKEDKMKAKLYFVNLSGRGIRGITEVPGRGLLLLAGPVGDENYSADDSRFQVYFWDTEENDLSGPARQPLCDIPTPGNAKAEAIHLVDSTPDGGYRFIIGYDGLATGGLTQFYCKSQ